MPDNDAAHENVQKWPLRQLLASDWYGITVAV